MLITLGLDRYSFVNNINSKLMKEVKILISFKKSKEDLENFPKKQKLRFFSFYSHTNIVI